MKHHRRTSYRPVGRRRRSRTVSVYDLLSVCVCMRRHSFQFPEVKHIERGQNANGIIVLFLFLSRSRLRRAPLHPPPRASLPSAVPLGHSKRFVRLIQFGRTHSRVFFFGFSVPRHYYALNLLLFSYRFISSAFTQCDCYTSFTRRSQRYASNLW